jgi:hypothetical protein
MSDSGPKALLRCGTLFMFATAEGSQDKVIAAWQSSDRERLHWLWSLPAPTAEQMKEAEMLEGRLRQERALDPAGK